MRPIHCIALILAPIYLLLPGCITLSTDHQNPATSYESASQIVQLPQIGKIRLITLHNYMFENSGITLALNTDSSIASIGNQDASSAASGVSAVGTAATDYTSALSSRNSAIAAQNTAISGQLSYQGSQAGYADSVDKAQNDCLTQTTALLAAGIKPALPCQ